MPLKDYGLIGDLQAAARLRVSIGQADSRPPPPVETVTLRRQGVRCAT